MFCMTNTPIITFSCTAVLIASVRYYCKENNSGADTLYAEYLHRCFFIPRLKISSKTISIPSRHFERVPVSEECKKAFFRHFASYFFLTKDFSYCFYSFIRLGITWDGMGCKALETLIFSGIDWYEQILLGSVARRLVRMRSPVRIWVAAPTNKALPNGSALFVMAYGTIRTGDLTRAAR